MKYAVDRIEDEIAVCEDETGKFTEFNIKTLYDGIKEGDHFTFDDNKKAYFLAEDTKKAREYVIKLQNDLFES